jgi:hypothetical protein
MKKDKNKGKKTLAVVGAVVAAGLSPGILNATPLYVPDQAPNAALTAAEVVAIGGNAYGFDELYAMQQPANGQSDASTQEPPQVATRYGVRPSSMYGVKRPPLPSTSPTPYYEPTVIYRDQERLDTIQEGLWDICIRILDADPYTNGLNFTLDSDLTRELEMSEDQLKALKAEIQDYYGVEVSHHRFRLVGQLNTLRLISEYIYKLKNVWR